MTNKILKLCKEREIRSLAHIKRRRKVGESWAGEPGFRLSLISWQSVPGRGSPIPFDMWYGDDWREMDLVKATGGSLPTLPILSTALNWEIEELMFISGMRDSLLLSQIQSHPVYLLLDSRITNSLHPSVRFEGKLMQSSGFEDDSISVLSLPKRVHSRADS
jgi:hypothetical protein